MASRYPIRPVTQDEFPAFYEVLEHAFNSTYPTGPELEHDLLTFEFDRTLAAFDGPAMVGTCAAFTLQLSVPGGMAAVAGVAAVGVLPTYRRRGILTSLMQRQLSDIRDRGEPVAALFASESGIYGRYGYAPATTETAFTIRRGEGVFRAGAGHGAAPACSGGSPRLRMADASAAAAELAQVYDSVLRQRPGMVARDDRWWDFVLWDPAHRRSGRGPLRCLIAEDDTGPRGYALYSAGPDRGDHWTAGDALRVRELMAADPAACAALWRDLLNRDLVSEVTAEDRPPDDPLPHLLADGRRTRPKSFDGMWVRLVSLPQALTVRRYACPVDVVIDVTDELLPQNAGRWRLRAEAPADPAEQPQAICERTTAQPDIALPVSALGAAYLGGTRLGALAGAGLVSELSPGRLAGLSAALSWDPAPWSATHF